MVRPASPACICQSAFDVKLIGLARHQFAVIALAAIALCSVSWLLLDVLGALSHRQTLGVAAFERRFDDIRPTIPPHSVYGYLSDTPPSDPSTRPEYYLTQYTLAPAIIKNTVDEPLVIVNFHSTKPDEKLLTANRLAQIKDFGNGVVLCRGRRK